MAKTKAKVRRPSQADVLRLGSEVAGVKASTKPATWSKFVRDTHAQGFTVAGALSGAPPALRERTSSWLNKSAAESTAAAYKPVYDDLNSQESRIAAWDEKRKADNAAYQNWLVNESAKIDASLAASDAALAQRQQEIRGGLDAAWQQVQAGALANAAAVPGTVSDPSQSTALNFKDEAAISKSGVLNAQDKQSKGMAAGQVLREMINKATLASGSAREGQRQADTAKALRELFDARSQTKIKEAGDRVAELARLQGVELNKAMSNRDFAAAAEKLGLAKDKFGLDIEKFSHTRVKDAQSNADRDADRALRAQRLRYDKGKSDLDGDGKVTAKDYALKKKIDKQYSASGSKGARKTTDGERKRSQDQWGAVTTIRRRIEDLHGKNVTDIRARLLKEGYSDPQIDVAEDLRKHGGKLSKRGRAKARAQLGILDETLRLP